MSRLKIVGLMSGTSLDGVDLALCDLWDKPDGIAYNVLAATTLPYPADWRERLSTLETATAYDYALANAELGHYLGRLVRKFLDDNGMTADAVASHGHTIFHQPHLGLTTQIGDGDTIAAECGLLVVSNFRTLDVALGGQGAPLVPIGDRMLFGQYDGCLNLGGIANISYDDTTTPEPRRIAYDICPCNMLLNRLAMRLGLDYDPDGGNARAGKCDTMLLEALNRLPYYHEAPPKSLGKEWFMGNILPLVAEGDTRDLLRTSVEHIAGEIAQVVNTQRLSTLLVTGGGALNTFLIEHLREKCPKTEVTVPDRTTVDYKEAIIFALLGYLRLTDRTNTLRSVTGARCDSIGGTISGKLQPHNYPAMRPAEARKQPHPC